MAVDVVTARPDSPLAEVIGTLVEKKIKRIVVADERGRLLGMVDRDAIVAPTRGSVVGKISDVGSGDELPGAWAVALTTTGAPERHSRFERQLYRVGGAAA